MKDQPSDTRHKKHLLSAEDLSYARDALYAPVFSRSADYSWEYVDVNGKSRTIAKLQIKYLLVRMTESIADTYSPMHFVVGGRMYMLLLWIYLPQNMRVNVLQEYNFKVDLTKKSWLSKLSVTSTVYTNSVILFTPWQYLALNKLNREFVSGKHRPRELRGYPVH